MANLTAAYEETVWLVVLLSESAVIVMTNGITLVVFARNRLLRKRSTYLIINLTVADLLVGVATVPLDVCCREFVYGTTLSWQYFVTATAYNMFPMSSLVNLCLLSLERLHATLCPFAHCLVDRWFYFKTLICNWLLAFSLASVDAVIHLYSSACSYYLWTSLIVITLSILTVCYLIIIITIKRKPIPYPFSACAFALERKLSMTLLIVTVVSALTILPYAIYATIAAIPFEVKDKTTQFHIWLIVYALYFACSFVNPLIYAITESKRLEKQCTNR